MLVKRRGLVSVLSRTTSHVRPSPLIYVTRRTYVKDDLVSAVLTSQTEVDFDDPIEPILNARDDDGFSYASRGIDDFGEGEDVDEADEHFDEVVPEEKYELDLLEFDDDFVDDMDMEEYEDEEAPSGQEQAVNSLANSNNFARNMKTLNNAEDADEVREEVEAPVSVIPQHVYNPRNSLDWIHAREKQLLDEHLELQKIAERYKHAKVIADPVTGMARVLYNHEDSPTVLNYKNLMQQYSNNERLYTLPVHDVLPPSGHGFLHACLIEKEVAKASEPYLPYKKEHIPEYQKGKILGTFYEQPDKSEEEKSFGDRFTQVEIAKALELYADHVLRKKVLDAHKSIKYTTMLTVFAAQVLNNRQLIQQYDNAFETAVNVHGKDITKVQKELKGKLAKIHARTALAGGAVDAAIADAELLQQKVQKELQKEERDINIATLAYAVDAEQAIHNLLKELKIETYLLESTNGDAAGAVNPTELANDQSDAGPQYEFTREEDQYPAEEDAEYNQEEFLKDLSEELKEFEEKRILDEYHQVTEDKADPDINTAAYKADVAKLVGRGTMNDISAEKLSQSRYFRDATLQALYEKHIVQYNPFDTIGTKVRKQFKAEEKLFLENQAHGESLEKLDNVGKFIDVILNLKYINAELETMIAKTLRLMYASRATIHDMVTCNKVLYILATTQSAEVTSNSAFSREELLSQVKSVVQQSEKEQKIINEPYEVSKEAFYSSSLYIPVTSKHVRSRQRAIRKY